MELRHLRYFLRATELLHFTRAAESLYVSQPTLSTHIQQLEEEFGSPLFHRSRQLRLTEEGQILLGHVRSAVRELEKAKEEIEELRGVLRGTLRVGSTHVFSQKLIPSVLTVYTAAYPKIHLMMQLGTSSDIEKGILAGTIDLGLALLPPESDEIKYETLASEEIFIVVSKKHPLAAKTELSKSDFCDLSLVLHSPGFSTRRLIDRYFAQQQISPKVLLEINDVNTLLTVVETSNAAAVASRTAVGNRPLHLLSLPGDRVVWSAGILYLRGVIPSPAAREFVKLLKTHF
jgi:LysR family cyn operon transcriptional activator